MGRWIYIFLVGALFGWAKLPAGEFSHIEADGRGGVYIAGYREMVHLDAKGREDRRESIPDLDPISDLYRSGMEIVLIRAESGVMEFYTKDILPAGSDTLDELVGLFPEAMPTPSTGVFIIDRGDGRLFSLNDGELRRLTNFDRIIPAPDRGFVMISRDGKWWTVDITGGSSKRSDPLPIHLDPHIYLVGDCYYDFYSHGLNAFCPEGRMPLYEGDITDFAFDLRYIYLLTPKGIERFEIWRADSE